MDGDSPRGTKKIGTISSARCQNARFDICEGEKREFANNALTPPPVDLHIDLMFVNPKASAAAQKSERNDAQV